jgi:quinol monooxygenase YgiN
MSHVAEFTLTVKPGHYQDVLELYSNFAHDFMAVDPHLRSVHIVGDPGAGIVRGIGVFDSEQAAAEVNSDVIFATFNEQIAPLISAPPQRVILDLVHAWHR